MGRWGRTSAAIVVVLALAQVPATAATAKVVHLDGVTATVSASTASITDGWIKRTWSIGDRAGVVTSTLTDASGHNWARPGPDFDIDIDGVNTSASSGWVLRSVTPERAPVRPGRGARGAALHFRYALGDASSGVELDRIVALHGGTAVLESTSTLHATAPVRVSRYSLDQIAARDVTLPAEVGAYNGGSDWRDDYRHVTSHRGAFDAEGEVARYGASAGYFLVSQRRGGSMSRVGRDGSGRTWIGVDWRRDLFDFGPLRSSPPDYNRLDSPAYPVPIRARTALPLQPLDLGTSFIGVYAGGAQQAAATFARDFVGGAAPNFARAISLNTFHPWGHGTGLSDANLRKQVDVAAALGVENFMIDDQWQGGTGGESGDWRFDAARFPDRNHDGVPDFVSYVQSKGMHLALWMSPLEFHTAAHTYLTHPQWACAPVGDATSLVNDDAGLGVWDATNPGFQRYIVGVVDRLVRTYHVVEFKFDFMTWLDCPPHDYADYEDAFVQIVRTMQLHHPNVTFELDETNDQRSWPFESAALGPSWFDNKHLHGSTPVAKLLHDVWTAAPWVPTYSLGVGTADDTLVGAYAGAKGVDALLPLSLLTHITLWTDLTKLSPEQRGRIAWWLRWYKAHRASIGPGVYALTAPDPITGAGWAAWRPWNGRNGYVFAFRQAGGTSRRTVLLHGLNLSSSYRVTEVRTGAILGTFPASVLAGRGIDLYANEHSAVVLEIEKVT